MVSLLRPTETDFWLHTLDQPGIDREPALLGCRKSRQVLKDMEHFPLPEAAQSAELLRPSQMAAQPSLARSWTGLLSSWNENKETKDKKRKGKCPILLLVP